MPGESAEDRARRAVEAKSPKEGQEMQQYQQLQSSIQEIQGEQKNNLMAARMGAEGDARENQAMLQAAELGMLGAGAGAVAVDNATPVQQTSPQTQAILSKYGVGKPKNQSTTTRSVQQTPTKITINNNTTNNTTNNVAVPPSNQGPVQGRAVTIKQQPDQGQARFKTWINNAFARQNQAAAQREKEYQRREWSLSRTTGKLMKKLQELGTTISERMDPRKLGSTIGGQLKTLLFIFGARFLAKNWDKVLDGLAKIEFFFTGDGNKEPGYKTLIKNLFGAKQDETIGEAIKRFFWNEHTSETGKDAGIFNIFLKKIKDYFSEGAAAVKSIELPKLDLNDTIGSVKSLIGYLGNVLSALFTGGEGLRDAIDSQVKEVGNKTKYGFNREGKDATWINDRTDINKSLSNYLTDEIKTTYGIQGYVGHGAIAYGDAIHTLDKNSTNYLRYIDLNKEGDLTGTVGSGFRASNSVVSMLKDKDTVNTVGVTSMLGRIEKAVRVGETSGSRNGLAIESGEFFSTTGLTPSDVEELKKSGEIKEGKFKYIVREKSKEELAQEYESIESESPDPKIAAINAGIRTELENVTGIGTLNKIGWTLLGIAGGLALCLTPGGQAVGIPLMMAAGGMAGMATGTAAQNTAVRAGTAYVLNSKKAKVIPRYKVELVPSDDPRPGLILGSGGVFSKATRVAKDAKDQTIVDGFWIKSGVINRIKDRIGGFKTKDSNGNEVYKSFDITDSEVRKHMDDFTRNTQMQLHGKVAENVDYDLTNYKGIKELEDLRAKHRTEQSEMWDNSRPKKSGEYIIDSVTGAVNKVFGKSSSNDDEVSKFQKVAFVKDMREAYAKKFDELGLDKKYIDALVAQDAYESNWGTSNLAKNNNNFGGIRNGNKGWQTFDSRENYVDYKVNLLNNSEGRYNAFKGEEVESMINRISDIYAPSSDGNKNYSGNWTTMYNQVKDMNPLSTDEIKALRNQGKWAEADMASASWERIEDVLTRGGVTGFRVTSDKREPGEAGKAGNKSYHTTDNLAIDIVPVGNQTFEGLKQQMLNSPIVQKYFAERKLGVLDETSAEMLKKTGGTGPHFHIGPDNSSVRGWMVWNKENKITPDNIEPSSTDSNTYLADINLGNGEVSNALNMANANIISPMVEPDNVSQVSTTKSSIPVGSSTMKTAGDIVTNNNTDNLLAGISDNLLKLNNSFSVIPKGQLAQIEAINILTQTMANIPIGSTTSGGETKQESKAGFTATPSFGVG